MKRVTHEGELDRLLERCKRGDAEAWSRLVDRFQALVYSVARRYGLSSDDAADVFQISFQSLYGALDRIESGLALPRWLAVTASRECLRILRTAGRTVASEERTLDEIVADEEADAETTAIAADRARRLREGLAELADRCRDLLTLLYLHEELPYTEISSRLGMPVGAIGPTRARCLEKLKAILGRRGFFE